MNNAIEQIELAMENFRKARAEVELTIIKAQNSLHRAEADCYTTMMAILKEVKNEK